MTHYIGIDIACKSSMICAVDQDGKQVMLKSVPTSVTAIARCLTSSKLNIELVGIETGTESHHLVRGLRELGFSVELIDARKAAPVMAGLNTNKNDSNDANALAQMLRAKMHSSVNVKAAENLDILALLKARRLAVETRISLCNQIRGLSKVHGFKIPGSFNPEIWETKLKQASEISQNLLQVLLVQLQLLRVVEKTIAEYEKILEEIARTDKRVKLLMTCPGVGLILAITFLAYTDAMTFSRSRSVGAFVGMTPREMSSGQSIWRGGITHCGPAELRSLLMQAGMVVSNNLKKDCPLRTWALELKQRKPMRVVAIAVGRKLASTMQAMLRDEKPYDFAYSVKKAA